MGSANRILLALAEFVLLVPFAQAQELDGTWKLPMRKLPEGITPTPPAVQGAYTSHQSLQNLNVFWHTLEGKPASYARISTYKMSDTATARPCCSPHSTTAAARRQPIT